ncbi:MAG: DUF1990 domain-containing protein [Planctomycetota bacterium]|nr:MAG: DUF1990 domain-containing protein [Planctomycetota bacterium]REK22340.1 MAG: DUF1990 domain-containing protein [Planctomycetota bacterium]REK43613.1 MAG: DUF1990 domain-containing protein [Planctomycetota bacterium]
MLSLARPPQAEIKAFLATQQGRPYSYRDVGISRVEASVAPAGRAATYDVDHQRGYLGTGEEVYLAACDAVRCWRMFPPRWTAIEPRQDPQEGDLVAMLVHVFGLWWLNACRIVYTFDEYEPEYDNEHASGTSDGEVVRRFGFAYGTLPDHVEMGEERFSIEQDAGGRVWYDLAAWSRPRHLLTRVGYPVARALQARFRRDSQRAVKAYVSRSVRELAAVS